MAKRGLIRRLLRGLKKKFIRGRRTGKHLAERVLQPTLEGRPGEALGHLFLPSHGVRMHAGRAVRPAQDAAKRIVQVLQGGKAKAHKGALQQLGAAVQGKIPATPLGRLGAAAKLPLKALGLPWTAHKKLVAALPPALRLPYKGALLGGLGLAGHSAYAFLSNPAKYLLKQILTPEELGQVTPGKMVELESALNNLGITAGKQFLWESGESAVDAMHTKLMRRNLIPLLKNILLAEEFVPQGVDMLSVLRKATPTGAAIAGAKTAVRPGKFVDPSGLSTLEKIKLLPQIAKEIGGEVDRGEMLPAYGRVGKAIQEAGLLPLLGRKAKRQVTDPESYTRKEIVPMGKQILREQAPAIRRMAEDEALRSMIGYGVRAALQKSIGTEEEASPTDVARNWLAGHASDIAAEEAFRAVQGARKAEPIQWHPLPQRARGGIQKAKDVAEDIAGLFTGPK